MRGGEDDAGGIGLLRLRLDEVVATGRKGNSRKHE